MKNPFPDQMHSRVRRERYMRYGVIILLLTALSFIVLTLIDAEVARYALQSAVGK